MASITGWSSMTTYTSPTVRPDKREKPDFPTLDQDGSGGLNEAELATLLEKGAKQASSSTSASGGPSATASTSKDVSTLFSKLDADGDGSISESELDEGMKPHERAAEEGGWAGMQMDTQSFATMMKKGPPPPPLPSISELDSDDDGGITVEEFGVSSDDEDDLFNTIDTDSSGDLSADEVSEFGEKMKTLFSRLQQMGSAEYLSVASAGSTTQTNDANLNLSA